MRGARGRASDTSPEKGCTIDSTTVFLPKMSVTNGFGDEIRLRTD
jgi:hypothetical protein